MGFERDLAFAVVGAAIAFGVAHLHDRTKSRTSKATSQLRSKHIVKTIDQLRTSLPAGGGGSNMKDALKVYTSLS
jgi:hypothetical protein